MKNPSLGGKIAAVIALAALFLPLARAQSVREVAFRTLCLQYADNLKSAYASSGKGGNTEVRLFTGGFSPVYTAAFTGDTATLYVEEAGAPDGKKIIASGQLAGGKQQLFLLFPDPDKKLPYRIHCMNDDVGAFPMGGLRFLNLAPFSARLELSGSKLDPVKPGGIETYPQVVKVDEWNMYQARIEFQKPDGKWATVSSPSWKASKLKRDLVVATFDAKTRTPRMFNFKDIPDWLEQPPAE